VLEQLDNLNQVVGMRKVDAVVRFPRAVPEIVRILVQNFQHRIPGKEIVVQRNHARNITKGFSKSTGNFDEFFNPPNSDLHFLEEEFL
jgi:hypothetical protein